MGESIAFIKDRAGKTIAAAKAVASLWLFQGQTIEQMQSALTAIVGDHTVNPVIPGQQATNLAAERVMTDARGLWDTNLDQLHRWTMQGVSMCKTRFKADSVKLALVQHLTARGDSRHTILDEALEWESAWNEADPTWCPLPANTLAAFKTLRTQCLEGLQNDFKAAASAWREQAGILTQLAAALEAINVAWYSDATDVFAAGTPEGDMIRGTIPTTYTATSNVTPPAPAPASATSTGKTP